MKANKKALISLSPDENTTGTLGTFSGVFTPSILTILGIILFMRLGYVVGNAGLSRALIIITIANVISVLTSISLSAVATNLKVKGGGDYYLISRTLGAEFGGSIGLVLFLAQSVSIAFYCIGFADVVSAFDSDSSAMTTRFIAFGAVSLLFVFAWLGSDWASKFQFLVMALLIAALVSFFWGGLLNWDTSFLKSNWVNHENSIPFWVLFAIFFPAVTGFTQGVSMSGDLKDPTKSLPRGTFMAVGLSMLIYLGAAVFFSASMPNEQLSSDYAAMKGISKFGFLIDVGVIAATLSSAMASFMGAPRILQSLSQDRVFPFLNAFAKGSGPSNNPRRGILLAGAIAFVVILLGQLNLVARIVSMFFLISYGLLNYATFSEARIASPSFRPRFKWFSSHLSLVGFLICLAVMIAIDLWSGVVAIAVLFSIHQYLKRTQKTARWADSSRAFHLQQVRTHLLAAHTMPSHDLDWQPRLLILNHPVPTQEALLTFSTWIEGGSGLSIALHINEGEGLLGRKERDVIQRDQAAFILEKQWPIFPMTVCAPDFSVALNSLIQGVGVGPLKPNTVVLNGYASTGNMIPCVNLYHYTQRLTLFARQGMNIILFNSTPHAWKKLLQTPNKERRIDVWWSNTSTGHLMLLLAYLMTRTADWDDASIRVVTLGSEYNLDEEKQILKQQLDEVRIEADPFIVNSFDLAKVEEHAAESTLIFLPFRLKGNAMLDSVDKPIASATLPVTAFVLASEHIDLDAEPEEGVYALVSDANDALEAAKAKMERAEKNAINARNSVEKLVRQLNDLEAEMEPVNDQRSLVELEKKVIDAERLATKAERRLAKETAKTEDASQAEEALQAAILLDPPEKEK